MERQENNFTSDQKEQIISLLINLLIFDDYKKPNFELIDGVLVVEFCENFHSYIYKNEIKETYNHFSKQYEEKLTIGHKSVIHSFYLSSHNTTFENNLFLSFSDSSLTLDGIIDDVSFSFLSDAKHPIVKEFMSSIFSLEVGINIINEKYITNDCYNEVIKKQVEKYSTSKLFFNSISMI
ncbi:hypothetical protein [Chishuiella changwenlii]|uniref:hypothetical protein n=1 Tax=Chishuiella changwenlii TaxID=1434701 RepID=UPI002FD8CCB0